MISMRSPGKIVKCGWFSNSFAAASWEAARTTVAVCDGDDFRIGNNGDALRLPKPRQAPDVTPVPDIEHLHCVVAKGSDEQPLGRCIDGQVVNATFDFRKLD